MAVKTFEREVKKLSTEFQNLIENYDFEEYDFHSIRQTLKDYIERTYPNYNDYFRSDYVMMLIELFAFYGEMMAYRMDVNMNEAYLSSAKERKNIIKIADMLGYKYARIEPAQAIMTVDISDAPGGARLVKKVKKQADVGDILSKKREIVFTPIEADYSNYYPYKLDYMFKTVKSEEFMNTTHNVFEKLTNFSLTEGIKTKRVIEYNFEFYERSIFIDKFQMRYAANSNIYVDYAGGTKMFELQNLKFDDVLYMNSEKTVDSLRYDKESLYIDTPQLGFEFVVKYDKGNNILDKNIYMYVPAIQGGTFTRSITVQKAIKNFKHTIYEYNIFNNPTVVRQYDALNNLIRTYYEVENLNNHTHRYAYEVNNTAEGHIELVFGDGKNAEMLLPAAKTLFYYRKNGQNSDEVMNIKNAALDQLNLSISFYDHNVGQTQNVTQPILLKDDFTADNGTAAETNEQIKYMARKLRSIQDRFVTGSDYETAGMLHPRVKYTTVVLRSYIGKNSPRMNNEFIEFYFDQQKNTITEFIAVDDRTGEKTDTYLTASTAYFTPSTVAEKYDSIKFVENGNEYYFEIFDFDSISPNDLYKYPDRITALESKGTTIKITNKVVQFSEVTDKLTTTALNNILPLDYSLNDINYNGSTDKYLNCLLTLSKDIDVDEVNETIQKTMSSIISKFNTLFENITIEDIKLIESNSGYSLSMKYRTNEIFLPKEDLSFIWTHYKSDDIYINPSKSNIIEIYVTGIKNDLKKGIEVYQPLTSSEINKLIKEIDKRKMISDIVQVYNSSVYEVEVAIRVYKDKNSGITDELLKSKINTSIDNFFNVANIPLGKHFHLSRLLEHLHKEVIEIQHIELFKDEYGNQLTPPSTLDILGEKIIFTQIVEKLQEFNGQKSPVRRIDIIS